MRNCQFWIWHFISIYNKIIKYYLWCITTEGHWNGYRSILESIDHRHILQVFVFYNNFKVYFLAMSKSIGFFVTSSKFPANCEIQDIALSSTLIAPIPIIGIQLPNENPYIIGFNNTNGSFDGIILPFYASPRGTAYTDFTCHLIFTIYNVPSSLSKPLPSFIISIIKVILKWASSSR